MADLVLQRNDSMLNVEFSNPARSNALSPQVVDTLIDGLTGQAATGLRLVIFTGQGKNFCAGFDLGDIAASSDADLMARIVRIEELLQIVFHAPFVTVAMAHGAVVGAGADLVCACTLRIAAPDATFRMPGLKFGVALGTRRLMHRIGADTARQLLLSSRKFDARHAVEIGFVNRIEPRSDWPAVMLEAEEMANTLPSDSVSELLAITCEDSRSADMAALVRTAGRPGLQKRILAYVDAIKRERAGGS